VQPPIDRTDCSRSTARPGVRFAALLGVASFVLLLLVSLVEAGPQGTAPYFRAADTLGTDTTRADTVTVDTSAGTTLLPDTLAADSVAADTLEAVLRNLLIPGRSLLRPERPSASLLPRRTAALSARIGTYWRHQVELDSTGQYFLARERVGDFDVRVPYRVDFDTYREDRLRSDMQRNWRTIAEQQARARQQQRRGGLGVNIVIPGGRQSAFTTIFGKPEVDLRVTGQADIRGGFDYRKNDQQAAITGRGAQLDPDFKQDLRLGITGSIGDKLRVDVNWDTNNQFDYQNQLKLQYTGYEDDIIQRIEAGNVFLQTPSSLIRGGQSLFGIKSEFQIGGVRLTTVASQQEGQSSSLSLSGGSETVDFTIRPLDYDDNTHYFLGYYFRNRWESALSQPPNVMVAHGFQRITDIEVWRMQTSVSPEEQNVRSAVAVVDLGESPDILAQASDFTRATAADLPRPEVDHYDHAPGGELDQELRSGAVGNPATYLENTKGLSGSDHQVGRFKRLDRGRDYVVDEVLGYISLRSRLQNGEALAVSYRYTANGVTY
jgi:cell surface protein SprA